MLHTCTMVCKVNQEFLEPVSCHLHVMEGDRCIMLEQIITIGKHGNYKQVKVICNKICRYYTCQDRFHWWSLCTPIEYMWHHDRVITSLTQSSSYSLFHAMNSKKKKLETWHHFSLPQREHSLTHVVCSNWYSDCQ